jgi:CarD family transcriptional regulator
MRGGTAGPYRPSRREAAPPYPSLVLKAAYHRRVFEPGDTIVHPHHGAGRILSVGSSGRATVYQIEIFQSQMRITVQADQAESAGLRPVMDDATMAALLAVLHGEQSEQTGNWNRRFRQQSEKIKSGDVLELGEVIRDLSLQGAQKPLSSGERQLLVKAKRRLASELQYARGTSEAEAMDWLESVVADAVHSS